MKIGWIHLCLTHFSLSHLVRACRANYRHPIGLLLTLTEWSAIFLVHLPAPPPPGPGWRILSLWNPFSTYIHRPHQSHPTCLYFLHCVFLNFGLTFLHCVFRNVGFTFLHCVLLTFSPVPAPPSVTGFALLCALIPDYSPLVSPDPAPQTCTQALGWQVAQKSETSTICRCNSQDKNSYTWLVCMWLHRRVVAKSVIRIAYQ